MATLILPPRYTEDSIQLWKAANAEGWKSIRVQGWSVDGPVEDDKIAIYGEPLFAAAIAGQLSLVLLEPAFDWLANLPEKFTKRHIEFGYFDGIEDITYPAFVKPADDKCFPARVYDSFTMIPGREYLQDDDPILISEPVKWESEFRCFVLERKCTAISIYARYGQLAKTSDGSWLVSREESKGAMNFLDTLLNDPGVPIPPSVVIDIGRIKDKGWAILEANPSWGAGVYGCPPGDVLKTIARACIPETQLTDADKEWILKRTPREDHD